MSPRTSPDGALPSFLVIGAMKAGTTSLHHYLAAHPDLHLPATKELNYFRDEHSHARGLAWYRRQFAAARPGQVVGEVSPDYTKHPHHHGAPERIRALLPEVRLVYLVRHPVERMQSMYVHQHAAGRETRPIDVALIEDPHYLEVSSYAMQLERYLAHFATSQILVCPSEQLASDRAGALARVHRFIGVREHLPSPEHVGQEYYRGVDRRRRGALARAAADSAVARRAFDTLPHAFRRTAQRLATSPFSPSIASLSEGTRAEVVARLGPDLRRLRGLAPGIVQGWGLDALS